MDDWLIWALWLVFFLPAFLVHLVLARHALRAGNVGWVVIIFMMPFIGGFIYYSAEYRPALLARRLELAQPDEPVP